jgi:uncharacterized protein (TIGR03663 family)
MNRKIFYPLLWVLVFMVAGALRLPSLSLRPMHTDEAVHAFKFAELLETGHYQYNPQEYHGPALYYLTLPAGWLGGYHSLSALTESCLRLVPVIWGILTLLVFLILTRYNNQRAMILAALFYALSSVIVYYNRYYIHETLLSAFLWFMLAFGCLFVKEKKTVYAVLSGISLGLLIATKETWVLYLGAVILTIVLLPDWRKTFFSNITDIVLFILTPALVVAGLFYISFFTNPQGIADFARSFHYYFTRGAGESIHTHPWYYYIKMLFYFKVKGAPLWSEGFIIILAGLGMLLIMNKKLVTDQDRLGTRFIAVFTLVVIAVFSLLPYKIPWNMLGWMPGIAFLAGWSADYLLTHSRNKLIFYLLSLIFFLGFLHQAWQCWQLNYRYECSPVNPYVYAQPGKDIELIKDRLKRIAVVEGYDTRIDVIFKNHDYWPLPWYLRSFKYVGWWDDLDPENPLAPIIMLSVDQEENLLRRIYDLTPLADRQLYVSLFDHQIELRPGLEMRGYIRYDAWQKLESPNPVKENHP